MTKRKPKPPPETEEEKTERKKREQLDLERRRRLLSKHFLCKTLTEQRAAEIAQELGFVGIVDVLHYMAVGVSGSIECTSPRLIVKIKKPPRPKPIETTRVTTANFDGEPVVRVPAPLGSER